MTLEEQSDSGAEQDTLTEQKSLEQRLDGANPADILKWSVGSVLTENWDEVDIYANKFRRELHRQISSLSKSVRCIHELVVLLNVDNPLIQDLGAYFASILLQSGSCPMFEDSAYTVGLIRKLEQIAFGEEYSTQARFVASGALLDAAENYRVKDHPTKQEYTLSNEQLEVVKDNLILRYVKKPDVLEKTTEICLKIVEKMELKHEK